MSCVIKKRRGLVLLCPKIAWVSNDCTYAFAWYTYLAFPHCLVKEFCDHPASLFLLALKPLAKRLLRK